MTRVFLWGIGGKMGHTLLSLADEMQDITVVGGFDPFADPSKFAVKVFNKTDDIDTPMDVIIDFSRPEAMEDILRVAERFSSAAIFATTGYSQEQLQRMHDASDHLAVFRTSNFSIGVNLLIGLCRKAAAVLGDAYDIEIIEQHHNRKVDAPSGTALTLAEEINDARNNSKRFVFGRSGNQAKRQPDEIGIHAVRGGTVVGKHDVQFMGTDEVITLSHEAQSKAVFAQGALRAAVYLTGAKPGFYTMQDVLKEYLD